MKFYISVLLLIIVNTSCAQDFSLHNFDVKDSVSLQEHRKKILFITESSLYIGSLFALNELWYADYPRSNFHFINDNREWLQMDKIGHMSSSYYSGVVGIKVYKWAGIERNKAIWHGGLTGTYFLTIIEVLDGFSEQWGASLGDLFANFSGSFLAISQELKWNEQRIQLKYSYSPTVWAQVNPKQLGSSYIERSLKDYNGQTYWLTFNLKSVFNIQKTNFPSWFSLALGYSANKMLNPHNEQDDDRERQFLFSFDIDLNKIKTRSRILNNVLHTFGFIKFPTPAIELRSGSFYFHSIYY